MTPALFEGNVDLQTILFAVVPTLFLAWLAAFVAGRLARRVAAWPSLGDHLSLVEPARPRSAAARQPRRRSSCAPSLLLFPAFELVGLRPRTGVPLRTIAEWAFGARHQGPADRPARLRA